MITVLYIAYRTSEWHLCVTVDLKLFYHKIKHVNIRVAGLSMQSPSYMCHVKNKMLNLFTWSESCGV